MPSVPTAHRSTSAQGPRPPLPACPTGRPIISGSVPTTQQATSHRGATASSTLTVNLQFNSAPTGRAVIVDGGPHTAPWSTSWSTASTHPVNVDSPQTDGTAGKQYVFSSWSDGGAQATMLRPWSIQHTPQRSLHNMSVTTSTGSNGTMLRTVRQDAGITATRAASADCLP